MQWYRGSIAVFMSLSLATGPMPAWGDGASGHVPSAASRPADHGQLAGDERILHALNRFTFGPRPGEAEAVKAMGLERWFEQQLHPATIDDTNLDGRLAAYPALQWSTEELLYRLPSNAVIRQVIDGKAPMPQQPILRTVYENQVERVTARRKEQEAKKQDVAGRMAAGAAQNAAGGEMMAASTATPPPNVDPALEASLLALPPNERVLKLGAMPQPQLDAFLKSLKGPQRAALTADMTPELKVTATALENPERVVVDGLLSERLTRDIYAHAQLQEVMTDFWLNHFNVYLRKNEATPYYLVSYERDAIRPHALGKFEDLLEATAHSPAMLIYLDNAESTGPDSPSAAKSKAAALRNAAKNRKPSAGLNENYARELMELHTLGVNGGYTQADVIQAARILTGWTVDKPQRGGGFKFDANRHEPGMKKVLGKKFKENGEREGRDLLHMLATRPATAKFLSRELAIRFVSDDPPQALVDRMAKSYLKSGGDISMVLRTLFKSPEFWSTDLYRAKVKTPLEYVVSAARASNADITNMDPLVNALRDMGMPLYGCVPPTGYKWDAADWVSTGALVGRMNFALGLAANRLNGITPAWAENHGGVPSATTDNSPVVPESEEARLEQSLIPGGVSAHTRTAVLQQLQAPPADGASMDAAAMLKQARDRWKPMPAAKQDQILAGLLLGSPEFQRR